MPKEQFTSVQLGHKIAPPSPARAQGEGGNRTATRPRVRNVNAGNGAFEFGYALNRLLYVSGTAAWQRTHGGLRNGSPSGNPFPFPGELNTPERYAQRDRVLRSNYWHAGGGLSYSAGPIDLFVSITKYISGTDTHNGQAYTAGTTWYFHTSKQPHKSQLPRP